MPLLTRTLIKTSLIYFVLALLAGVGQPLFTLLGLGRAPSGLGPASLHLFVVGWLTLLIFGVAFWMFPKYSREQPRRSEGLGWAVYVLINLGLVLRVVGAVGGPDLAGWGWLLAVSALLQWAGALGFVINTWGRVKEK